MKGYRKMYAGVYIFEGIDNVGKTTIIQELYRKIEDERDDNCITLAFPGHEPRTLGGLVYDIHHHIEDYLINLLMKQVCNCFI